MWMIYWLQTVIKVLFLSSGGEFMKEIKMNDLGHMTYILGVEFHTSKKGPLTHQRKYALEILKKII